MMITLKKLFPLILCCAAFSVAAQVQDNAAAPAKNTVPPAEAKKEAAAPVAKAKKEVPAPVVAAKKEVTAQAAADSIYKTVEAELAKYPVRVPGTPEYYKAIDAMEKILKDAGIEVKRQTYRTLVPAISKNEFSIDGKPVQIHPLAPNNAALVTTGENPINAPIVYIPKEELYKNYGKIDGKIVVMEWGENYYPRIFFTEGVKAIIFIGNDKATQWDVAKLMSQYNVSFPYFYMTAEEAKRIDLTSATLGKERKAHLQVFTRWNEVEGINLWAVIDPAEAKTFNLNQPEAIVLGARMDTFGMVPGLVSGERQTANLALFAETAAGFVKKKTEIPAQIAKLSSQLEAKRKELEAAQDNAALAKECEDLQKEIAKLEGQIQHRALFLVVYGSSFNAYDSLRYFFFPIFKRNVKTKPLVEDYAAGFEKEQADNVEKLKILNQHSPIIREYYEVTSAGSIWTIIFALVLVAGCVPLAIGIKNRRKKMIVYSTLVAVASGVLLVLAICGLFDRSVSDTEKSKKDQLLEAIEQELTQDEQKLASGKLTAEERKQLEDSYYKQQNKLADLKKGKEDKKHYQVRVLIREAVIKDYNIKNYRLADVNLFLRKHKVRQEEILQKEIPEIENRLKEKDVPAEERTRLTAKIGELKALHEKLGKELISLAAEKKQLDIDKVDVANLRKVLNERNVSNKKDYQLLETFIRQVKQNLTIREKELSEAIKMATAWNQIAEASRPYAFVYSFFFDFSSDSEPFMFCSRSYEGIHSTPEMSVSAYTRFFEQFKESVQKLDMQKTKSPYFMEALKNSTFTPDTMNCLSLVYLPHAAALPLKMGSFTMRNVPGAYDFDEIPGKHEYKLDGLIPVADELLSMMVHSADFSMTTQLQDMATYDSLINYYYDDDPIGQAFSYLAADGKEVDGPAIDAIATAATNEYDRVYPVCGFSLAAMGRINHIGYATMPLVVKNLRGTWWGGLWVGGQAFAFDDFGRVKYINQKGKYFKLFRAYGGPHNYAYAPLTSNFCGSLVLVNGFTDGKFNNFRSEARVATGEGYAYIDKDVKGKIYFFNETFILGISPEDPIDSAGSGIPMTAEDLLNLNVSRMAVYDTIRLNLGRLDKLHKRNIFNGVIEQYHDKAEQHRIEAEAERKAGNIDKARAHEVFGQTLAIRAYRPLRDTINDLVKSVLILLILTIPFSFAMERLLIGATNIYKQLGWTLIMFVATFLLLYFTHPAFALSQAPMIIFIAFFIIVMSVVVIYIVMNRFKGELMALQGLDTSAHRVNSENSMLLAAIIIGVSSMRNRPVKTFLTILTVVLLTFTIISFASFESTEYVRPVYMGDASGESRIESFLPQHVDLLPVTCQSIKDLYQEDYHVFYRSVSYKSPFYINGTYPLQSNIIYNPASTKEEKSLELEAIVGFEMGELNHSAKLRTLMPKLESIPAGTEDLPGVYLSTVSAEEMELKPGDVFFVRNMKVRLDGVFKSADLDSFTYLDGGKVAPPNFEATATAEEKGIFVIFNNAYVDASNFIWSSPDTTMLTDYETASKINGFVNAVILYPKEDKNPDIVKDATSIAEVAFGIVYSNTPNGVYRHFMAPVFSASGFGNLIVPLLLGALIILSSLLGSITDREREIFTFSALGLSPKDVSFLFFAESGVYAVIGGLGGYLLSQLTNAILIALSKRGILEAPEMNYSSMTTVYTILIVMALVMLSTIYPAIKAGRAASPDVARKWKMPPPDGDNLCFQFPFTVSRIDFGGILVFISEHFANHADSSLGNFAASNVQITHGESELTEGYMLSVDLTLAPFDLGVAESLKMYSAPSDIEGVDVVTVSILRKDGSKSAWLRGNRRFVDEIRNQFLLWRSLPVETVMHYRELAASSLKGEAVKEGAKA